MRQQSDLSFSWQLITTQQQLDEAIRDLAGGSGPLYVDTERASGYTYFNSACLIQIGREGAPNLLIDPFQITDFHGLAELFANSECVLHAASQDLPCLAESCLPFSTAANRHRFPPSGAGRRRRYA